MIIYQILKILPNNTLKKLENQIRKKKQGWIEPIEYIRLSKFVSKTDFEKLNVTKYPVCLIEDAEWDYSLFNICFVENMLKNIVYCLSNGYRPVIAFKNSQKKNLWEEMLVQPYGEISLDDDLLYKEMRCDVKTAKLIFPIQPTKDDVEVIGKLYQRYVIPNKKTEKYFTEEYETLLKGKRVLGVLCRGTDYTEGKPAGHPVQPELEELLDKVREKYIELSCEAIYLATEEERIYKQFELTFPGKIIVNKRHYFDDYYRIKQQNKNALISCVSFERDNDNYFKALEYFSSLNLLSKCCALVAGNCGGSRAALYLNRNKYEYSYLFDKGLY